MTDTMVGMRYVVLLRGINVGGNNTVSMSELKRILSEAGFDEVVSYINSGNILLTSDLPAEVVNARVEETIKSSFELDIPAITIAKSDFLQIAEQLPANWKNDNEMRCDCLFLWSDVDAPEVVDTLTIRPDIDRVKYVPGALFWSIDRKNVTRSGLAKIIGTPTYKRATIRNCNTVRKLAALLG